MITQQDLKSKTIVITGATAGIGLAAARALAGRGAYVIGVGRSAERCGEARQAILSEHPNARIDYCVADLSSQRQARALAASIGERVEAAGEGKIDILINNAGTVSSWYVATEDGYELQFAVNHLAPFLLTHELMPMLRAAPSARVITTSSGSHYRTSMHWADVMYRRRYSCLAVYKQSKLANVLFTAEFNRRLGDGSTVRAYAVDPGLVNTEIGLKGTGGIEEWVWQWRRRGGVSAEQGAATAIFLASEPVLEDPGAIYWKDCRPAQPSRYARRPEEAARLWSLSERLCGIVGMVERPAAHEVRGNLEAVEA
ncbi:MAG: SDR family NAD(P)-dependent oxidoreductase [Anaerolineae bacterium]|nr:SDR family NAD(P)-dependent oxidoreductase [Anaerolineae bacterium]